MLTNGKPGVLQIYDKFGTPHRWRAPSEAELLILKRDICGEFPDEDWAAQMIRDLSIRDLQCWCHFIMRDYWPGLTWKEISDRFYIRDLVVLAGKSLEVFAQHGSLDAVEL